MFRTATLVAGLMLAAPVVAYAAPTTEIVETRQKTPAPAEQKDSTNYAERETQDKQVAEYEGGNTVVIGISGGALVVLLVLLLLL